MRCGGQFWFPNFAPAGQARRWRLRTDSGLAPTEGLPAARPLRRQEETFGRPFRRGQETRAEQFLERPRCGDWLLAMEVSLRGISFHFHSSNLPCYDAAMKYPLRSLSAPYWLFIGQSGGVLIGAGLAIGLGISNIPAVLFLCCVLSLGLVGTVLLLGERLIPKRSWLRVRLPPLRFSLRALLIFVTIIGVVILPIGIRVFRAESKRRQQLIAMEFVQQNGGSVHGSVKQPTAEQVTTIHFESLTDDRVRVVMPHLRQFPNLKELHVYRSPRLTDKSVERIAELSELERLHFHDVTLTDQSAKHLRRLTHLKHLFLSGDIMTDKALPDLASLQSLEQLALTSPKITNEGVAALSPLSKLQGLYITGTSITDAGLRELGKTRTAKLVIVEFGKLRLCPK